MPNETKLPPKIKQAVVDALKTINGCCYGRLTLKVDGWKIKATQEYDPDHASDEPTNTIRISASRRHYTEETIEVDPPKKVEVIQAVKRKWS